MRQWYPRRWRRRPVTGRVGDRVRHDAQVGTGDAPVLKRYWDGNWADDATDQDIYILINTAAGDDVNLSCKIGAGSSYSDARDVVLGTHLRLYDENGDRIGKLAERGLTMVPLRLYWKHGIAKVRLALVRGKKRYDKRQAIKKRETDRDISRAMRRR